MADWVNIQNANLEPNAPLISSTMFALRDNVIALAQGAPGAPRIAESALVDTAINAGNTNRVEPGTVIRYRADSEQWTSEGVEFQTVVDEYLNNTGRINIYLEHQRAPGASGDARSFVRIMVNNNVIWDDESASSTWVTRNTNITIHRNVRIRVQHRR